MKIPLHLHMHAPSSSSSMNNMVVGTMYSASSLFSSLMNSSNNNNVQSSYMAPAATYNEVFQAQIMENYGDQTRLSGLIIDGYTNRFAAAGDQNNKTQEILADPKFQMTGNGDDHMMMDQNLNLDFLNHMDGGFHHAEPESGSALNDCNPHSADIDLAARERTILNSEISGSNIESMTLDLLGMGGAGGIRPANIFQEMQQREWILK